MSVYDPLEPLSDKDRKLQATLFSHTLDIPSEFKNWIKSFLEIDPPRLIVSDIPTLKGEDWRFVGGTGQPAFSANWSNTGGGTLATASFFKDPLGIVHMRGFVEKSVLPAAADIIFTLPAGYRPDFREWFVNLGNDAGTIAGAFYVSSDGTVNFGFGGGAGDTLCISCSFRAA